MTISDKFGSFVVNLLEMSNNMDKNQKRLVHLAEKFEVFTNDEYKEIMAEYEHRQDVNVYPILGHNSNLLGLKWCYLPTESRKRVVTKITVCEDVFAAMLMADPTENKMFLQWMLTSFVRLIKDEKIEKAIQFADEDLDMASSYLELFEANKRKKRFRGWGIKNEFRKWKVYNTDVDESVWAALKYDPSDINQYKSLAQLFDAVDPFIEREPSDLERGMNQFVKVNEGEIPFKDRKWTVFIPKSTEANALFDKFASWCTARPNNGMFKRYTDYKTPDGGKSTIYIIINNKVFTGDSKEMYQIHFESKQVRNQSNGANLNLYDPVLSTSDGIREYFHSELDTLARMKKGDVSSNLYIDYLISFGYTESFFNYLDKDLPIIKIKEKEVPLLTDVSKFHLVEQLLLIKLGMRELHPSIGKLHNLQILTLSNNKLTRLPKEIGMLKNLDFFNIKGNKITDFPDELAQLDPSNGGTLFRLSVDVDEIGADNLAKLHRLLPNVTIATD